MTETPAAPKKKEEKRGKPYTFRGQGTSWYQPLVWSLGKNLSRVIAMILFRPSYMGTENYPRKGPVLIVTNHQSFLDPWFVGMATPRQVHYMARDTLFKGGILHWLMEVLNSYPVKRGSADLQAIRHTVERLQSGYMVNIFPEGTRSQDGTIGPIAAGVSVILARAKIPVPVVPVVIDGAFECWPRNKKLPHPGRIRILAGKPIPPEELAELSPADLALRIRQAMIELQKQLHSPHAEASAKRNV